MPLDPTIFARLRGGRDEAQAEERRTPEVPERDATDDEVPRGAATVVKAAEAGGWEHREVYSRGWWGEADEPSDFLSVRGTDGRRDAFVLYRDGKAIETWTRATPGSIWRRAKVNEVKKMMKESA